MASLSQLVDKLTVQDSLVVNDQNVISIPEGTIQIGETEISVKILELYLKDMIEDSKIKYPEYYI